MPLSRLGRVNRAGAVSGQNANPLQLEFDSFPFRHIQFGLESRTMLLWKGRDYSTDEGDAYPSPRLLLQSPLLSLFKTALSAYEPVHLLAGTESSQCI